MRKYRTIFIHIPKCAGSSVLQSLAGRTRPRDHCAYHVYRSANPVRFESYFKFSFVRHPVSRLNSLYTYFAGGGNGKEDLPFSAELNQRFSNVNEFVLNWLSEDTISTASMFRTQSSFVVEGTSGKLMVDFVGRQENFSQDCNYVFEQLGVNAKVHGLNRSTASETKLSDASIEKIKRLYAVDFETFDYE